MALFDMFDPNADVTGGSGTPDSGSLGPPWWQGPPPPGYSGQWPPTLPPGASYGPNFGQINYAPGTGPTFTPGQPGGGIPSAYDPNAWGNTVTNTPTPIPSSGMATTPTTTGSLGSLLQPFTGAAPVYQPAQLPGDPGSIAPTFPTLPPWAEPTGAQVRAMPGYQFGFDQGRMALDADAAARGVLNTGGTLEDVLKFGQNYADQNYQTFRQNSLDDYMTNLYTQYIAPYNARFSAWQTQYPTAANFSLANATGANAMNQNNWLQSYNIWRNRNLDTFNQLYSLGSMGAGVQ